MKPEDAQRDRKALEIFGRAIEVAGAEARAACLEEACGGDAALHARVEALLANHVEDSFLQNSAAGPRTTLIVPITEQPGDRIGRYKLLQQIGEGGCGVVYMAEQEEPVRRRIALKVIKLGMDTRQVVARFEAERQALAMMDHPNIARVFDAGATDTGRPYFVMELVRGIRITEFCDQQKLSTRARLDLFMQVCSAIQHAHQKGIIHRDLKPSNILVTTIDGTPVPKVIDFGIAKATNQQRLTNKTLFTAFEQFIGTPAYMSPEQAEMSGVDIDTRSDIYSLGVVLYELLTGRTPFDAEQLFRSGLEGIRKTLREQEPSKPSTALDTLAQPDLTTVAHARHTEPPRLLLQVRGDLDWIVMKCLEKDRSRRYETANGVAADLKRHLNHEPVTAAAPSAGYRLAKFARRNRGVMATAVAFSLLLLTGTGISVWQAVRATRAERGALTEAQEKQQIATFLQEMLGGVRPAVALGRDTTVLREILEQAEARMRSEFTNGSTAGTLHLVVSRIYYELGDHTKAEALCRESLTIATNLFALESVPVASALNALGGVLASQGKLAEAEPLSWRALALRRKLHGAAASETAESLNNLATLLRQQGKLKEAEAHYRQALEIEKKLHAGNSRQVAGALYNLALLRGQMGELEEAERLFREALAMHKRLRVELHPDVALTLNDLSVALLKQHKLPEAEALQREALAIQRTVFGETNSHVANSLERLAETLLGQSKLAEANTQFRHALAIHQQLFGAEAPETFYALAGLIKTQVKQGQLAGAEKLSRPLLVVVKKLPAGERLNGANSLHAIAKAVQYRAPAAAAEFFREALAIKKALLGSEHTEIAHLLTDLAGVIYQIGELAEADLLSREALAQQQKLLGKDHAEVAAALSIRGLVVLKLGNLTEADTLLSQALAMNQRLLGDDDVSTVQPLQHLAAVRVKQNQAADAEALLRQALAIARKSQGENHPRVAKVLNNLALTLADQGRVTESEVARGERLFVLAGLAGSITNKSRVESGITVLTKLIQKSPDVADSFLARGFLHGRLGQWPKAADDLAHAVRLSPDFPVAVLGPLLAEVGDTTGYLNFCGQTLVRQLGTNDPQTAAGAALVLSIQAGDTGLTEASQLAEVAVTRGTNQVRLPHFQLVKALTEYRRARFTEAADWADKSQAGSAANDTTAVAAGAVLAMSRHQLKQPDAARQSLAQAIKLAETKLPRPESGDLGENWPEWLVAHILLREARAMIEGAEIKPRDAGDQRTQPQPGAGRP